MTPAPADRRFHSAAWTGSEMIIWGGSVGESTGQRTDTFAYTPDRENFQISSAVLDGGDLLVSFPSLTGQSYTLWQSDTMADGTWTDTGLPAVPGTGGPLTFTLPAPAAGRLFVRVQAGP